MYPKPLHEADILTKIRNSFGEHRYLHMHVGYSTKKSMNDAAHLGQGLRQLLHSCLPPELRLRRLAEEEVPQLRNAHALRPAQLQLLHHLLPQALQGLWLRGVLCPQQSRV